MTVSERFQAEGPSKARLPAKEPGRVGEQRAGRRSGNRVRDGVAGQPSVLLDPRKEFGADGFASNFYNFI